MKTIRVGDIVRRKLGGAVKCDIKVTEIDDTYIHCGPWKFLKTNGAEVDEDCDWDGITQTGSYLSEIVCKVSKRYEQLLHKLAAVDNESEEADAIREEMDPIWHQLTSDEQIEARRLSAKLYEEET